MLKVLCAAVLLVGLARSSHFRGATISWKADGNVVTFTYRIGWRRSWSSHTKCYQNTIDSRTLLSGLGHWKSTSGWQRQASYYCTDFSVVEDWQQGEDSFSMTFPSTGKHLVIQSGYCCWITARRPDGLSHDPRWHVETHVQLDTRSDTGKPNSSPITASSPIYRVQRNCDTVIRIPSEDPDGDRVRCRYGAVTAECGGACDPLPFSTVDEENCVITYDTSLGYLWPGWYAISLVLEDYPIPTAPATTAPTRVSGSPEDMTTEGGYWGYESGASAPTEATTRGTPLSRIPLQFLVHG
ncbi:uncharacterized protein LOC144864462 [Branchiostoma floridae x Branchiostoma japonicum]